MKEGDGGGGADSDEHRDPHVAVGDPLERGGDDQASSNYEVEMCQLAVSATIRFGQNREDSPSHEMVIMRM